MKSITPVRLQNYLSNPIFIIILTVIAFVGYITLLTDNLFPGGDNARYLIFAKSLAAGNGYRNIGLVSEPSHGLAPPGFAFLLTFIIKPFGFNIILAKAMVAFWGALSILVVYIVIKQRATPARSLLVAALYAITPVIFMYSRRVYSDMPFMVFALLALICVQKYADTQSRINRWLLVGILCIAVSFYLRPAGLTLLLVSGIWLGLIKRDIIKVGYLVIPVIVAIFPWYYWVSQEVGSSPAGHFSAFGSLYNAGQFGLLMLNNLYQYLTLISENLWYLTTKGATQLGFSAGIFVILTQVSVLIIIIILAVGFYQSVRNDFRLMDLFVIIYLGILLPYTYVLDRFIIPILPFIIFYYLQGIYHIADAMRTRFAQNKIQPDYLPPLFILIVVLSSMAHIGARIYQEQNFDIFRPTQAGLYELASWAKEHIEPSAVVLSDKPDFFYIYAERQTVDARGEKPERPYENLSFFTAPKTSIGDIWAWLPGDKQHTVVEPQYCSHLADLCLYSVGAASRQ